MGTLFSNFSKGTFTSIFKPANFQKYPWPFCVSNQIRLINFALFMDQAHLLKSIAKLRQIDETASLLSQGNVRVQWKGLVGSAKSLTSICVAQQVPGDSRVLHKSSPVLAGNRAGSMCLAEIGFRRLQP